MPGTRQYRTNNALVQTFSVDSLNQLSTVGRSGTLTVAGTTGSPGTNVTSVTVADNGNSPVAATVYADKTFARSGVSLLNGTNTFTAVAQDAYGRSDTNFVTVNLPSSLSYAYDANGNLTSDGTRSFTYDDENQLASVSVSGSWWTTFVYDGRNRLRIRLEYLWQNSAWVLAKEVHYIYDGSLVIQERDGNNIPTITYTRGLDLGGRSSCSSGLDGAGGIGGLLARTDNSLMIGGAADPHAYYHADANGNVTMLVNSKQFAAARYLYDSFGKTIAKSGPLADANVYRFSSKEYHATSGLCYFGRRFYDPNLQRWLNRDPIGIQGGLNLYSYAHQNAVDQVDPFGLIVAVIVQQCFDNWKSMCEATCAPWGVKSCTLTQRFSRGIALDHPLYNCSCNPPPQQPLPVPAPSPAPNPANNNSWYCAQHPYICTGIAVGVIGLIAIGTGGGGLSLAPVAFAF